MPSPPVGLILQSEDQQLLELYQLQSLELMRITEPSGAMPGTMEQSLQVALPPVKALDSGPITFGDAIHVGNAQHRLAEHVERNDSSPMDLNGANSSLLEKIDGKSSVFASRFMDVQLASQQTISVSELKNADR